VTLASVESLQPLFAAKVVEATTLSLPEDDVEEVDPEEALARILDHDHDALVVGPGLKPSLSMTALIRGLLGADEDGEPVPAVLDAEALRSLATVDGWASDVAARCVLTPHVGEFLRLRAADGNDPEKMGNLVFDDARRIAAAREAAGSGARWWSSRARARSSPNPAAGRRCRLSRTRRWPAAGTGDVLAGTIGALLAQGLGTFEAAQLGVYLHGMAGEAVRARLGDAGLLASDLGPELPLARKRLAALAAPGRRPRPRPRDRSAERARGGSGQDRPCRRGRQNRLGHAAAADRGCARAAAAAAAAHCLDRDRPGRPRVQRPPPAGLAAVRDSFRSGRQGDAYGHGAVPVARALVGAGVRSLSVATFDEGLELRQAGISVPILVLFPIPPELVPDAMRLCLSVTAGDQTLLERTLAVLDSLDDDAGDQESAGAASRRAADPPRGRDRSRARRPPLDGRPGRGRRHRGFAAGPPRRPVVAPPGGRRRRQLTAAQAARLGVASSLLEEVGMTMPDRHLAASGGLLAASAPGYDVVRIGLACTASCPTG
jgi:NAD(P)H-hydrate repair Nnr-like enzyme with NAD(P)H-hydrate dehydratase domain